MPPQGPPRSRHIKLIVPADSPVTGGKFLGEGQTTASGRDLIIKALASGATVTDVSRQLHVSRDTVYRWKKRFDATGQTDVKPGRGRARTARTHVAARTLKAVLRKGCPTWNVLRGKLAAKGHIMSKTTVREFAKEHNGHSVSVLVKPPLSAETRQKRLKYAQTQSKRPSGAWRTVVFMDEAACAPLVARRVIKLRDQPTPTKHIDKRAAKLHFFGYISAAGKKSKLHFLAPGETWTAARLAPLIRNLKRPGLEVVLDGASPHGRLKRELETAGAIVLPHPPYSPDLNLIENIWAYIKAKAAEKDPKTPAELQKALEAAWAEVTPTQFRAYADSMHRRMESVKATGGEHTKS